MKRLIVLAAVFFTAWTLGLGEPVTAEAGSLGVRGVWVSCFDYDSIGLANKTEAEFRTNANRLFANISASGCNTVYFHVRSFDDAIYPSAIVPWSKRMTEDGAALPYDPLSILVSGAHAYGLKFHAWMNPYRVTKKKILDPGKKDTVNRIVKQVGEIVKYYKVDGIHFDDYFYPTHEKKYKSVKPAKRRKIVNAMVRRVYKTVKARSSRLQFGISPAGDIGYCQEIGADVKRWMSKRGYVDYIVPQIYWSNHYIMGGKRTALFNTRLKKWRSLNKRDVPMYIGLALYRAGNVIGGDPGWRERSTNIASQLKKIRRGNTEGYVLFAYPDLYRDTAAKEVKHYLEEIGTIRISRKKKTLRAGNTFTLSATVWPSRCQGRIRWKSSDKKIATVNKQGVVTAKKKGKVRIYASFGKRKKSCVFKIKPKK